eukprot:CAMPEP_0185820510 /NCGR_PEP_ID=MMETSP1322-20130828/23817_1 /TAXON_ID=265543 /ORGANISM="Minutocellus polymorphus, Strain RCC2270" /LENGTH=308 /DNA_ID=CAMNT_0028517821 /DNA_START=618 /DNA_END=1547 /DNA_ORIENTATION=-
MSLPRTKSARQERRIRELQEENDRLRALVQERDGQGGDMDVEEEDIQMSPNADEEGYHTAATGNNTNDDEDYSSTAAITGIDDERLDGGASSDEEREILNAIQRDLNAAEENNAEEQKENGSEEDEDEDEDSEPTDQTETTGPFEPDLNAYTKLSDDAKSTDANCLPRVLAMFGQADSRHCQKGYGVAWAKFLEEIFLPKGFKIGKRAGSADEALVDLHVGVWRKKGSERGGRQKHVGLIWRDGEDSICIFDPHNNNLCHRQPNIIVRPSSRQLGTVDLIIGVYPPDTPMRNEIGVVEEIAISSSDEE